MMSVMSSCCGAAPRNFNNDSDSTDIGICPACGEHCEFTTDEDEGEMGEAREPTPPTTQDTGERI